jgi:hypothetical protein
MGVADIRDAINNAALPAGVRCTACMLSYCDRDGGSQGARDHQLLSFTVADAKTNATHQLQTRPLPAGSDLIAAALAVVRTAVGAPA